MANEKKAGSLILSQLGMFNEAVMLFGEIVEPKILESFDDVIKRFAESNGWSEAAGLASDNGECWLAPPVWNLAKPEDDVNFKATFDVDCINGGDDYWTAVLCNQGTAGGEAGFKFSVAHNNFGGRRCWNAYANSVKSELILSLASLGFKNLGKGEFFLPVRLDANLMASTWEEDDEFASDNDVFNPVRDALEKIKQSIPIFDQILANAPMKPNV